HKRWFAPAAQRRTAQPCLWAAGEATQQLHVPGDDEQVLFAHPSRRIGIGEVAPRALDAHDGHAVLVAHTRFAEREALDLPRRTHLHHGEVTLIELDVLHHPGTDQVGHAPTRIRFGVEDVVGADAVEDLAVRGRDRL